MVALVEVAAAEAVGGGWAVAPDHKASGFASSVAKVARPTTAATNRQKTNFQ